MVRLLIDYAHVGIRTELYGGVATTATTLSIHVFADDERLSVPVLTDGKDESMLIRLRWFYRMISIGQGFPALVSPKQLQRIDSVEVCLPLPSISSPILLSITTTLSR